MKGCHDEVYPSENEGMESMRVLFSCYVTALFLPVLVSLLV